MADTFKGNRRTPWGRRIVIALLIGLVALVPAYFMWSASLQRQLDAEVAALRAAGEPMMVLDLATQPVPDERNAVVDLRRAAATLSAITTEGDGTWRQITNNDFTLPMTDEAAAQMRAAVEENRSVLEDVAKATTKPAVDWQLALKSPVISILLPDLNHQRHLAVFLKAAALDAHLRGDDAAAVEKIRHALFQADAVGHQPFLVSHLTASGVASLASNAAEQIAPDLRVGGNGAASPEQVRGLIDDLLDDAAMRESFRRALRGERASQLDTLRCVNNGTIPLSTIAASQGPRPAAVLPLAFKPLVLRDGLIMLQHSTGALAAAAEADFPGFNAASPPMPPWMTRGGGSFAHPLAKQLIPAFQNSGQTFYRGLAERRLTATLLAIRWYAAEHEGRRPGTLDELVPRYLPAVPIDPLASGGKPIRYLPNDQTPSVYSVGPDGRDNNGSSTANRWQSQDFVIPLDRPKPTTQPAVEGALAP